MQPQQPLGLAPSASASRLSPLGCPISTVCSMHDVTVVERGVCCRGSFAGEPS